MSEVVSYFLPTIKETGKIVDLCFAAYSIRLAVKGGGCVISPDQMPP